MFYNNRSFRYLSLSNRADPSCTSGSLVHEDPFSPSPLLPSSLLLAIPPPYKGTPT